MPISETPLPPFICTQFSDRVFFSSFKCKSTTFYFPDPSPSQCFTSVNTKAQNTQRDLYSALIGKSQRKLWKQLLFSGHTLRKKGNMAKTESI